MLVRYFYIACFFLIFSRMLNNELISYWCYTSMFILSLFFIYKSFNIRQFKEKLVFIAFFSLSSFFILWDIINITLYRYNLPIFTNKLCFILSYAMPFCFLLLCITKTHIKGSSTPYKDTYNLCYKRAYSNRCLKAIFCWLPILLTRRDLAETCKIYDGNVYHGYVAGTGEWIGFEHRNNYTYIDTGIKITPERNEFLRSYHGKKFAYSKNCLILSKRIMKEVRKI